MRRPLITLACLLTLTHAAAQIGELRNNFAVGVNAGVNINSATFQPKIKQLTSTGPTGGIVLRYVSEKYFSMICGVQAEINYSQRGWNELFEMANPSGGDPLRDNSRSYRRTLSYIDIPFLAHLAWGRERGMQFFANLGPQVGFLIGDSETKAGAWDNLSLTSTQQAVYGIKVPNKFDYGIAGGLGLELRTGIGNFLLEGRYYFALSDFYNTTKRDYFGRAAHSTIAVKACYLLDLCK